MSIPFTNTPRKYATNRKLGTYKCNVHILKSIPQKTAITLNAKAICGSCPQ